MPEHVAGLASEGALLRGTGMRRLAAVPGRIFRGARHELDGLAERVRSNGAVGYAEFFAIAVFLASWIGWAHVIAMAMHVAGSPLRPGWAFAGALAAAAATTWLCVRRDALRLERRRLAYAIVAVLGALAVFQAAARHTIDLSTDGSAYHAPAVDYLVHGWNPVYETNPDPRRAEDFVRLQIEHFPKHPWLVQAVIGGVQGSVQSGRMLGFVWFVAVLLVLLHLSRRLGLPSWLAAAMSLLLTLNPVVINQALTFYADGILYLALTLTVASLVGLLLMPGASLWVLFAVGLTGMLGTKFTGAAWGALFVLVFGAAIFVRGNRKTAVLLGAFAALTALVAGWEPYVVNTLERGHPFFPIQGRMTLAEEKEFWAVRSKEPFYTGRPRAEAMAKPAMPRSFRRYRGPWKGLRNWYYAAFSPPTVRVQAQPKPRNPFDPEMLNFRRAALPHLRSGGYGPLFPLALVISVPLAAAALWRLRRGEWLHLALPALLLATVVVHPAAWMARYVPQLWAIPILLAAAAWLSESRWAKGLALTAGVLAAVNVTGLTIVNGQSYWSAGNRMRERIEYLRSLPSPVDLRYPSMGAGLTIALRDLGLDVTVRRDLVDCPRPHTVLTRRVVVCLPEGAPAPR